MINDRWGGETDDLYVNFGFDDRGVCLHSRQIEFGAKQVNWAILKGDTEDITREDVWWHGANVIRT
jgi:hypothetical protein